MTPPFRRSRADTAPAANQSEVREQRELLGGALRDSDIGETWASDVRVVPRLIIDFLWIRAIGVN